MTSHGHDRRQGYERISRIRIWKFGSVRIQPFLFNHSSKKKLEQTSVVLFTFVQGSINIESMSEIDFLAVSAILMTLTLKVPMK